MVDIGQTFYTSWGYDQTNYDFIVVMKVSPSGKTAYCQQAAAEFVRYEGQCDVLKPTPKGIGPIFQMKVEGENLRGTYAKTWGEDRTCKKFRLDTFYPDTGGEHQQTNPMFGH
jgi:hypothetical protein